MDKYLSKIEKTDTCWNWTGTISNGYGQLSIKGKNFRAHRLVYEALVGRIPFPKVIDHLCKNRKCVNPAHLEVVSLGENTLRSDCVSGINKRKTQCKNGHPFSFANTAPRNHNGKFWRICRICRNDSIKRLRAKRKAEKKNYQCIT